VADTMPRRGAAAVRRSPGAEQRRSELERLYARIRRCTKCPRLVASRTRPTVGYGSMRIPVMIVGLNPSRTGHNESGIPFQTSRGKLTPSGRPLTKALEMVGVQLEDLYFTELTKCFAPDNRPTDEEIENCASHITRELELLAPQIVIALGSKTAAVLHSAVTKQGGRLVPIKHPSYVQRFWARCPGRYRRIVRQAFSQLRGTLRHRRTLS
jgi:DNA polymerase